MGILFDGGVEQLRETRRQFAIFGLADRVYENKMSIADIVNEAEKHVNTVLDQAWAQAGA